MGPSTEQQILSHVLQMSAAVGELTQKVERLQVHLESQGHNVIAIRDTHTAISLRLEDHTGRLSKMETAHTTHAGWRSRTGGVIVGVTMVLAVLGSAFAIWKSMVLGGR